jgi:formamidase
MKQIGMKSPIYVPGPVEPQFGPGRYIYFEGFSVDEHGKQHYMDATVAYRQTSLRAIEYLRRYGYDDYQSYLLLGCAPVQGHVAGIVDVSVDLCRRILSRRLTNPEDSKCLHHAWAAYRHL